jgi:hypothetical protein
MNFIDALGASGPSAIGPLETNTPGKPSFYAAFNGGPILKNGKFGPESSFETEDAALDFAKQYAKAVLGWVGDADSGA